MVPAAPMTATTTSVEELSFGFDIPASGRW
jgi:hypothetical protein